MNRIHPTAVIGENVTLGDHNTIGPYTVILGNTQIGSGNWIGPHSSIGSPGEIRGAEHPATWAGDDDAGSLIIGDNNVIRDFVSIHSGVARGTVIGNDCYIMNKAYIAHDGLLENGVTISGSVMIGGHSTILSGANLGMNASVHQRSVIGERVMVGMGAVVTHHLPPFAMVYGTPARVRGGNKVGMQRAGIADEIVTKVVEALEGGNIHALEQLCETQYAHFMRHCELSGRRP